MADDPKPSPPAASPPVPAAAPARSRPAALSRRSATLILLAATAASLLALFVYTDLNPSTDDAYVFANVIGIACRVEGPITAVHVRDNQAVRKGDLLLEIDPTTFEVAVNRSRAEVARLQAASSNARQYAERVKIMAAKQFMTANDLDNAEARKLETEAELEAALAKLAEAELNLQYTRLYAPVDGVITNFRISPGVYVKVGQEIFALIDMNSWFVSAFFKETVIRSIQPNQQAAVTLNMYPGHTFEGHVEGVGWGTFQPDGETVQLLPQIEPTVDWVRLATRFPVRINMDGHDPKYPLRIGARAVVTVNTTAYVREPAPYPTKTTIWDWLPWE